MPNCPGNTTRRVTSAATARTRPPRPAATPDVPATGAAAVFGNISGIAPRARIAAYKVCWETGAGGSCFSTDSVAAIDQAVADGVDVINFSISGSQTNFRDPVEIAFLFAADAGVFVAASAGNSGPTTSTVAHPGPWLTTVAAGTHNRDGAGSVTLGNGVTYNGASVATRGQRAADRLDGGRRAGRRSGQRRSVLRRRPTAASRARPCEGGRQDRGLRSRRHGTRQQEPRRAGSRRRRHDPGQHQPTARSTRTSTSCRRCTSVWHSGTAIKAYAATAGATATINQATIVLTTAAPVHRVVLLARTAARRQRRHAEARPDRPGPGHPGRRCTSGKFGPPVRPVQRHVDVQPARGRPGRAVQAEVPELVADGDQVGADDHRV